MTVGCTIGMKSLGFAVLHKYMYVTDDKNVPVILRKNHTLNDTDNKEVFDVFKNRTRFNLVV